MTDSIFIFCENAAGGASPALSDTYTICGGVSLGKNEKYWKFLFILRVLRLFLQKNARLSGQRPLPVARPSKFFLFPNNTNGKVNFAPYPTE